MEKDTLYYDGACPVCRAEIGKLARFSRGRIELKDIHELDGEDAGLDKNVLLSRLHLKTAGGEWVTGLKANIRAWRHTPFRHLWRILDWPPIRPVSERCYEYWLRRRAR
jgi:predicted DCC family thiol-disulfide oxidoreductase YuxK